MDNIYFNNLKGLGNYIIEFTRAMENYRAVVECRETLAERMRISYPNMKVEAIRSRLWEQETRFSDEAKADWETVRMHATSIGLDLPYLDMEKEVEGILRKPKVNFSDINV